MLRRGAIARTSKALCQHEESRRSSGPVLLATHQPPGRAVDHRRGGHAHVPVRAGAQEQIPEWRQNENAQAQVVHADVRGDAEAALWAAVPQL